MGPAVADREQSGAPTGPAGAAARPDQGAARPAPIPECPRCGYDQSGVIATWTTASPVVGTCSECGLDFQWRDVLSARYFGPGWSYEHGTRPRAGRCWATACRTLVPWAMWSRLALPHAVRRVRLGRFALIVLLVGLHLPAVLVAFCLDRTRGPAWWPAGGLVEQLMDTAAVCVWPYGESFVVGRTGWGRWFSPFMTIFLLIAFLPALFMPLTMLVFGQTFRRVRVRRVHLLRGAVYSLPTAVAGTWVLTALFYWSCYWLASMRPVIAGLKNVEAVLAVASSALLAWLGVWWWFFIARYLRLPHASLVSAALVIIAGLGTAVVFFVKVLPGRWW